MDQDTAGSLGQFLSHHRRILITLRPAPPPSWPTRTNPLAHQSSTQHQILSGDQGDQGPMTGPINAVSITNNFIMTAISNIRNSILSVNAGSTLMHPQTAMKPDNYIVDAVPDDPVVYIDDNNSDASDDKQSHAIDTGSYEILSPKSFKSKIRSDVLRKITEIGDELPDDTIAYAYFDLDNFGKIIGSLRQDFQIPLILCVDVEEENGVSENLPLLHVSIMFQCNYISLTVIVINFSRSLFFVHHVGVYWHSTALLPNREEASPSQTPVFRPSVSCDRTLGPI